MKPAREDIEFEPLARKDPYVDRLLVYAGQPLDTDIDFGWRIFVRGEPFGLVWIDYEPSIGVGYIHGLTACRGRYVPYVSVQAFRLAESAVKSLGLIPAVVYPKDYLHVKRLCDIVWYKSVSLDDETMIATAR